MRPTLFEQLLEAYDKSLADELRAAFSAAEIDSIARRRAFERGLTSGRISDIAKAEIHRLVALEFVRDIEQQASKLEAKRNGRPPISLARAAFQIAARSHFQNLSGPLANEHAAKLLGSPATARSVARSTAGAQARVEELCAMLGQLDRRVLLDRRVSEAAACLDEMLEQRAEFARRTSLDQAHPSKRRHYSPLPTTRGLSDTIKN